MKYAILQVSDGDFLVKSEHGEDLEGAIVAFHSLCSALWNEKSVKTATVKLVDENISTVMGKEEHIKHDEK